MRLRRLSEYGSVAYFVERQHGKHRPNSTRTPSYSIVIMSVRTVVSSTATFLQTQIMNPLHVIKCLALGPFRDSYIARFFGGNPGKHDSVGESTRDEGRSRAVLRADALFGRNRAQFPVEMELNRA